MNLTVFIFLVSLIYFGQATETKQSSFVFWNSQDGIYAAYSNDSTLSTQGIDYEVMLVTASTIGSISSLQYDAKRDLVIFEDTGIARGYHRVDDLVEGIDLPESWFLFAVGTSSWYWASWNETEVEFWNAFPEELPDSNLVGSFSPSMEQVVTAFDVDERNAKIYFATARPTVFYIMDMLTSETTPLWNASSESIKDVSACENSETACFLTLDSMQMNSLFCTTPELDVVSVLSSESHFTKITDIDLMCDTETVSVYYNVNATLDSYIFKIELNATTMQPDPPQIYMKMPKCFDYIDMTSLPNNRLFGASHGAVYEVSDEGWKVLTNKLQVNQIAVTDQKIVWTSSFGTVESIALEGSKKKYIHRSLPHDTQSMAISEDGIIHVVMNGGIFKLEDNEWHTVVESHNVTQIAFADNKLYYFDEQQKTIDLVDKEVLSNVLKLNHSIQALYVQKNSKNLFYYAPLLQQVHQVSMETKKSQTVAQLVTATQPFDFSVGSSGVLYFLNPYHQVAPLDTALCRCSILNGWRCDWELVGSLVGSVSDVDSFYTLARDEETNLIIITVGEHYHICPEFGKCYANDLPPQLQNRRGVLQKSAQSFFIPAGRDSHQIAGYNITDFVQEPFYYDAWCTTNSVTYASPEILFLDDSNNLYWVDQVGSAVIQCPGGITGCTSPISKLVWIPPPSTTITAATFKDGSIYMMLKNSEEETTFGSIQVQEGLASSLKVLANISRSDIRSLGSYGNSFVWSEPANKRFVAFENSQMTLFGHGIADLTGFYLQGNNLFWQNSLGKIQSQNLAHVNTSTEPWTDVLIVEPAIYDLTVLQGGLAAVTPEPRKHSHRHFESVMFWTIVGIILALVGGNVIGFLWWRKPTKNYALFEIDPLISDQRNSVDLEE